MQEIDAAAQRVLSAIQGTRSRHKATSGKKESKLNKKRAYGRDARCVYCNGYANSTDHVLPRYRGGSNRTENVVPSCTDCNNEKDNRFVEVFFHHHPAAAFIFLNNAIYASQEHREAAVRVGSRYLTSKPETAPQLLNSLNIKIHADIMAEVERVRRMS